MREKRVSVFFVGMRGVAEDEIFTKKPRKNKNQRKWGKGTLRTKRDNRGEKGAVGDNGKTIIVIFLELTFQPHFKHLS